MLLKTKNQTVCYLLGLLLLGTLGCDFEKDLDLDLDGPQELFVEAYLESGKPGLMLLTTTQGYFDSLSIPLVQGATATITSTDSGGQIFRNTPYYDRKTSKLYNYLSYPIHIPDGQKVSITVSDTSGRTLTGQANALPIISIDSIVVKFSPQGDSTAYLAVWFTDPGNEGNFYRLIINKDSLGSPSHGGGVLQDNIRNGKSIVVRTGFNFSPGEKVYARLFHIEKAYYGYLESVSDAQRANGNPFAQPALIKSTVKGGKGVFTILRYDMDSLVIPNP